jgi:hypothetical protein
MAGLIQTVKAKYPVIFFYFSFQHIVILYMAITNINYTLITGPVFPFDNLQFRCKNLQVVASTMVFKSTVVPY